MRSEWAGAPFQLPRHAARVSRDTMTDDTHTGGHTPASDLSGLVGLAARSAASLSSGCHLDCTEQPALLGVAFRAHMRGRES